MVKPWGASRYRANGNAVGLLVAITIAPLQGHPMRSSSIESAASNSAYESFKHSTKRDDLVAQSIRRVLEQLFSQTGQRITFKLWDGTEFSVGNPSGQAGPRFTLILRDPRVLAKLIFGRNPLRVAQAYFADEIDIDGDFYSALALKDHLHSIQLRAADKWRLLPNIARLFNAQLLTTRQSANLSIAYEGTVKRHSKLENRDAIAFHYDLSNAFYALWLDPAMVYSCAYFEQPDASLEQAQRAKLDLICRKLLLRPGEQFLDIGCGWGALAIHAARHYDVRALGVTLSKEQFLLARQRVADAGLQDRVSIALRDYRDLQGAAVFDKVASVGMFEHIGLKKLPTYFQTVHRLLKPGGLLMNHCITHSVEGWDNTSSTRFINQFVFPDGQLDRVSNVQRGIEDANFEIFDLENLRPHYALTLRHWVHRLEQHRRQALEIVSEASYRVWRLYMAACALALESDDIGVYQILSQKRGGQTALPLTRRHLVGSQCVNDLATPRSLNVASIG